jgi:hypothetical protein
MGIILFTFVVLFPTLYYLNLQGWSILCMWRMYLKEHE